MKTKKHNQREHNFIGQSSIRAKVKPGEKKKEKHFAVVQDSKQFIICLVKLSLEFYWQTTEQRGTDMQMKC